ncbi:polysaccharide pyruvyl transferase family protein [Sulfitobacter sp. NAS-14.1]|uniref:polysaccharide pyruvyl transferase family protein n=1 Tax=Sulfitobacter sp. (strain NAS-14.1) TaxID=314267 RepID=UPI0002EB1757|nr:polysaccharide pyruvyl transferase family protein [Sulfitobacter sp. NAS-14.1]
MTVLVLNDTRIDRHIGCNFVMGAIRTLLARHGLDDVRYWPAHADPRNDPNFHTALATAKLVVINGEGTIHHNRPAGKVLLAAGQHARSRGVPVALINTGWEANSPELVATLNTFDLVAARDSHSASQMRSNGTNVRVVPDLSLALAQKPAVTDTHHRVGIAVTDNVDRLKALELEHLRRDCDGESLAISHAAPGIRGWARFLRDGISLREDLSHPARLTGLLRMRHRLSQRGDPDSDSFTAILSGLELLVSGRFHACTLALAGMTPVIAQSSNTGKIAALFQDAGLDTWRCMGPISVSAIEDARERGWSDQERDNIILYRQRAVLEAERLFEDIAGLASS